MERWNDRNHCHRPGCQSGGTESSQTPKIPTHLARLPLTPLDHLARRSSRPPSDFSVAHLNSFAPLGLRTPRHLAHHVRRSSAPVAFAFARALNDVPQSSDQHQRSPRDALVSESPRFRISKRQTHRLTSHPSASTRGEWTICYGPRRLTISGWLGSILGRTLSMKTPS
jgi:hypothetical protein